MEHQINLICSWVASWQFQLLFHSVSRLTWSALGMGSGISFKRSLGASCTIYLYALQPSFHLHDLWEIFLCFTFQLPAFWFTGEFFLLFGHNLVPFLRRSFIALFPCPKLLRGQCNTIDESLGRISLIFSTFPSVFSNHYLYLRDILHASRDLSLTSYALSPVFSILFLCTNWIPMGKNWCCIQTWSVARAILIYQLGPHLTVKSLAYYALLLPMVDFSSSENFTRGEKSQK